MDINTAAAHLTTQLRERDWYTAIGVGGLGPSEIIIIYTSHKVPDSEISEIRNSYPEHCIEFRTVGLASPA